MLVPTPRLDPPKLRRTRPASGGSPLRSRLRVASISRALAAGGAALGLALAAPGLAQPDAGRAPQASAAPAGQVAQGVFAFTNVDVLPMDRERVLEDRTVIVRDGVIVTVGPAASTAVPDDAVRIEGRGRFLMPGLAEMHAHVPPAQDGRPPAGVLDDLLFLYVANGVTTIRGMLGAPYQLDLREELRRDEHLGPSFYVAAPSLNGQSAPTPEAAENLIRSAAAAGYDLQKIHPGVSRAAWDRMVATAREVGITWGGHVPQDVGVEHALATGTSTIDHMDGYLEASGSFDAGWDDARMRELARLTREAGTYVVPTHYLWENLYGARTADEALEHPEMRYVSPQQRQAWRTQSAGGPDLTDAQREAFLEARDRMLVHLAEANVPLLMGTDSPQLFNVPGFALHRELREMAEAGVSTFAILASGTRNVGRYVAEELGLEEVFGQVAEGHRADLVLLEENPLDDLEHLSTRAGVMVRGRWVPREEIDAGLERLAAKHAAGG